MKFAIIFAIILIAEIIIIGCFIKKNRITQIQKKLASLILVDVLVKVLLAFFSSKNAISIVWLIIAVTIFEYLLFLLICHLFGKKK